jgi:hypothetical protein
VNLLIPLFIKDQDREEYDLQSEMYSLAEEVGWDILFKELLLVLSRSNNKEFWHQAASVIYWAASDNKPLPFSVEECLARLYRCLELYPGLGQSGLANSENLVWSIASKFKGVSYESSWNPRTEPEIERRLASLRASA